MAEKMLKTRVINKHETQEDWEKAVNFIPLEGEVIIYDPDNNHKKPRIKIGDGILNPETGIVEGTNVNDLPFITDSNLSDGTKNNSVYQESEKDDTKISLAFTDVRPPEKEDYIGIYNRAEYIGKNATALGTSVAKGDRSLTSGSSNLVGGKGSIALGTDNLVISASSAALGYANFVNGEMSVALGASNVAREKCAVALNGFNNAYGRNSLATGNDTTAMGNYTLTGGLGTYATGGASVALGNSTKAEGECSFTTGYKTQSNEFCQTVVGRHNDLDKSKNALFVVGNGCDTDDKDKPIKRNAFTVNMDGTATLSKDPVYNMDVATKKYVDNSINNIEIPDAGNKSLVFDTKAKLDSWINELPGGKNLLNPWDYDKDKILTQGYVSRDGSIRLDYNTVIDPDAENLTFTHNRYVYNLNLEAGTYTIRAMCDSIDSFGSCLVYSKFFINDTKYDLLQSTEGKHYCFTKTFELTENSYIELQLENNQPATAFDCWVQLEKGSTPTEYETYIPPYVRENDHLTKNDLNIGDLLLVEEENVPDYYWDGNKIIELEISLPENIVTKEELSNKISLWQPNTEYKVGDVCLVGCMVDDWPVHAICACIEEHTSDYDNAPTNFEQKVWNKVYVSAGQSYEDVLGNVIHTTYATKEELSNKISLWQPNTEYKFGDIVLGTVLYKGEIDIPVQALLKCNQDHISSNESESITDYHIYKRWDLLKKLTTEVSVKAIMDDNANIITNTYATKEELEEALENIPTGEGGGVSPEEVTTIVKEQFPGGVGYIETVEIVPETSVTTVADASMGGICMANLGAKLAVETGKTYAVMFNGVRYECVSDSDSVLGNRAFIGAPVDTGEPFMIVPNGVLVTRTEMDVTLSVVEPVAHKLNTDFLQDDVPKYGKVGELMVFEWDGNTEGLDTFVDNGIPFYKVSDVVIPVEHIVSLKSERSDGHTSEDVYTNSYGCLVGQYSAAIVTNAENNNIPSNGVYFRYTAENGIRCLRVEIDTRRENTILYLNNPSGVKYAITVDDSGVLSATEVTE